VQTNKVKSAIDKNGQGEGGKPVPAFSKLYKHSFLLYNEVNESTSRKGFGKTKSW